MRESELWARLGEFLAADYLPTWADSVVHASIGGRTVRQALEDGIAIRQVWLAACESLDVPLTRR